MGAPTPGFHKTPGLGTQTLGLEEQSIKARASGFPEQMRLRVEPLGSGRERYFWPAFLAPGKREGLTSLVKTGTGGARFQVPARAEGREERVCSAPSRAGLWGPFYGRLLGPDAAEQRSQRELKAWLPGPGSGGAGSRPPGSLPARLVHSPRSAVVLGAAWLTAVAGRGLVADADALQRRANRANRELT